MQTITQSTPSTQPPSTRKIHREMHKVVWILLGVFTLFVVTFPTALWRVSQKDKFNGSHLQSFPLNGKLHPIADNNP